MHGLVALMEIQASRAAARTGPGGEPILLLDQNRARWDQLLIRRGLAALERAEALIGGKPGPYVLQAAIAACHARARRRGHRLGAHRLRSTSTLADGDAVAGGRAEPRGGAVHGVRAGRPGWRCWTSSMAFPACRTTTCCPACAATSWPSWAAHAEARVEFERAASLTRNKRERTLLLDRAAACDQPEPTRPFLDSELRWPAPAAVSVPPSGGIESCRRGFVDVGAIGEIFGVYRQALTE